MAAGKKDILGPHWGWGMVLDLESGWKHQSQVACSSLVPSRGPLFLFTAILIFCSLVLVTDLSQPEKENWLLVSFLQNFSLSPFSPGLHISLFKLGTAEVITPVFFSFWNLFLLKSSAGPWPVTSSIKFHICLVVWESPISIWASLPNTGLNTGLFS